jgi:hypothetical protein
MASKALHGGYSCGVGWIVGRRMLRRCRSRLSHFPPKTYAEVAGSSESNAAPPRPDPLRVWAMIAPSFEYYSDYKNLSALGEYPQSRISIHRCYKL